MTHPEAARERGFSHARTLDAHGHLAWNDTQSFGSIQQHKEMRMWYVIALAALFLILAVIGGAGWTLYCAGRGVSTFTSNNPFGG